MIYIEVLQHESETKMWERKMKELILETTKTRVPKEGIAETLTRVEQRLF